MSNKKYIILISVTIIALLGAYMSTRQVVSNNDGNKKNLLMPDLEQNIDKVGTVIIRSKGGSFKVHMENGGWVMPNKYSYPIGSEKVRDLVQNSARTYILETKTAQGEELAGLGLDDPEKQTSSAIRIVLLSADEKTTYADYIRGLNRKGVSGASPNEIYARLFSSDQAYLVHGELNFDLSAHTLLSGETFAVKPDNMNKISFNFSGDSKNNFTIGKNIPGQPDYEIMAPQGAALKAFGKASSIAGALENMSLEDIVKREDFPKKDPEITINYKTFNGLNFVVKLFKIEQGNWMMFSASGDATNKQAVDDAARINKLAAPWVYKVDLKNTGGGFEYKLADMIRE